jgi:hypothetical protein
MEFGIYRKLTITDFIIPNTSCHPQEHKKSTIHYLMNRTDIYPLSQENRMHEWNIMQTILKNNGYQPIQNTNIVPSQLLPLTK